MQADSTHNTSAQNSTESFWTTLLEWWNTIDVRLFKIDQTYITLGTILYFIVALIGLFWLTKRLKTILVKKLLKHYDFEPGTTQNIATLVRYILLVVGFLVVLQAGGINLSSLSVLAGALGVGIGFGLQNIANNFISGIIILSERPIKIGDRIEVGEINGDVIAISARATTVLTNDNITIIVPNSDFISKPVINWSHNDKNVRFKIPVGVSYNEDPAKIKTLLLKVAKGTEGVLATPAPEVWFVAYGESSLDFTLNVWTADYTHRPKVLISQLYFNVFEAFKQAGVEIPFPQRDLHLRSGFEKSTGAK